MKRFFSAALAVFIFAISLFSVSDTVQAQDNTLYAADISDRTEYSGVGYDGFNFLKDGNLKYFATSYGNTEITLKNDDTFGIGNIYIVFDIEYGEYTLTDNDSGKTVTVGQYSFLHDYHDLKKLFGNASHSVTVSFNNGAVRLSEIKVFSPGEPDPEEGIQIWEPPLEGSADMVLFTTHGDDDQLFFAGLLPLYGKGRGYAVQAVYLTDHRNLTYQRTHEILNGLWSVGITAYPVMGGFGDYYVVDSLEQTYNTYEYVGVTRDELLKFVVTQVRRFKPQVAVAHDFNGEYGHGMHMLYTDLLVQSLDVSSDASVYPDIAEKYGTWDIPKTYVHLYEENPITLDLDQPLNAFDGLTAFEVTQKYGYPCHESQQYTWFTNWINGYDTPITKASQIEDYSPCKYGLYRTTVGPDTGKNDMMENIVSYAEQERLAEEERKKQEEEKRQEEERKKQEQLKKEQEEKERQELLKKQQEEEKLRLEQEKQEQEKTEQIKTTFKIIFGIIIFLVAAAALVIIILRVMNKSKRKKRKKKQK